MDQLNLDLNELQRVLGLAKDCIFIINTENKNFEYVFGSVERYYGYTKEEMKNMKISDLYKEQHEANIFFLENKESTFETTQIRKDKGEICVEVNNTPIEIHGKPYCMSIVRDMTIRKRYHDNLHQLLKKLKRAAMIDELTQAYNRYFLHNYLYPSILDGFEGHKPVSFILIDVDNFKKINDSCSHVVGDEVLKHITKLIQHTLRRGKDSMIRLGGDEFLLILQNCSKEDGLKIYERVKKAIASKAFEMGNNKIPITLSAGGCTILEKKNMCNLEELIEQLDGCLYSAKAQGGGRIVYQ